MPVYHVVRVNRDNSDTHAAPTRTEAIELAMLEDFNAKYASLIHSGAVVVEHATVEAPDAGAARLAVPAGAWRRLSDADVLSDLLSQ